MDIAVASAVLLASLLHASWHALVKASADRLTALAGMNLVSGIVAACAVPFVAMPSPVVLLLIGGSVLLHVGYKIGLAQLYVRADLGQAYPLARGLTPVAATLLGIAVFGELPPLMTVIGIGLISAGLVALMFERAGRRITASTVGVAALTGLAVASYSVVDAYGVRLNGDWLSFTAWLILCDCATFLAYVVVTRGGPFVLTSWRRDRGSVLLSGCLGVLSFSVFIWALSRAPVGPVSALRETSVFFAAVLGVIALRETPSWTRCAAAIAVTAGIMTIAAIK